MTKNDPSHANPNLNLSSDSPDSFDEAMAEILCDFSPDPIPAGDEDLCRALWLAVIVQAVNDACTKRSRLCYQRDRKFALEWIHGLGPDEGRDFEKVCELAGVDPVRLRRMIDLALAGQHGGFNFRCLTKHMNGARRHEPEGRRSYFERLRRSDAKRLRRARKLSEQALASVDS